MNTKSGTSEVRELFSSEVDLIAGGTEYHQVLSVDLGNMKIQGFASSDGQTLGIATSGADERLHYA